MSMFGFVAESLNKFGDSGNSYHYGETIILIGKRGLSAASLSPLYNVGWSIPGQLLSISPSPVKEKLDVELGQPKIHIVSQIIKIAEEVQVQLQAPKLPWGFWLGNANNNAPIIEYESGVEGVIAASPAPTKSQCDLDDITGFGIQNLAELDLTVASYGGFKEMQFINEIQAKAGTTGTIVYDDVSYAPAAATTVKKVKDVKFKDGGRTFPNLQILALTMLGNNEALYYKHWPNVDVFMGTPFDPKAGNEHAVVGFSFKSKPHHEDIVQMNGTTQKVPVTRIDGFIPKT